jgi:hypothetical protein
MSIFISSVKTSQSSPIAACRDRLAKVTLSLVPHGAHTARGSAKTSY